jgi:hypothetical protein
MIKHHFVLNVFLAIFTSFSFPKLPNILEINNRSCLQFVKIRKLNFQNLKRNVLSNQYNTIHFFMSNEVMKYKLYLNKKKHNKYIKYTDIIQPLVEFKNTSYSFNKVFFEHCINFYCFYQILKMFLCYAKPIFYHNLQTPRFAFSKKRAKKTLLHYQTFTNFRYLYSIIYLNSFHRLYISILTKCLMLHL